MSGKKIMDTAWEAARSLGWRYKVSPASYVVGAYTKMKPDSFEITISTRRFFGRKIKSLMNFHLDESYNKIEFFTPGVFHLLNERDFDKFQKAFQQTIYAHATSQIER